MTSIPQIIEVVVAPGGQTQVQTKGFSGRNCQHASDFLEQDLGKVVMDKPTAEMHGIEQSTQLRHQN
jgi:hypothetical protein